MPQLDPYIFSGQFLWFILIFLLTYYFIGTYSLKRVIEWEGVRRRIMEIDKRILKTPLIQKGKWGITEKGASKNLEKLKYSLQK